MRPYKHDCNVQSCYNSTIFTIDSTLLWQGSFISSMQHYDHRLSRFPLKRMFLRNLQRSYLILMIFMSSFLSFVYPLSTISFIIPTLSTNFTNLLISFFPPAVINLVYGHLTVAEWPVHKSSNTWAERLETSCTVLIRKAIRRFRRRVLSQLCVVIINGEIRLSEHDMLIRIL